MLSKFLLSASNVFVPTDPNFSNVVLLLHGDGTNGSTTFVDNSQNTFSPTVGGNAQITTAVKKYGTGSITLDGNGDYLSYASNSLFDLSADFTIECFINPASVSGIQNLCARQGTVGGDGLYQFRLNGTTLEFVLATNGNTSVFTLATGSGQFSTGNWDHVAVTRSSTSIRLFINGTLLAVGTSSYSATSATRPFTLGILNDTSGFFTPYNGRIDEFRFTRGVARYTSSFTAPTEPFPNQ